MLISKGNLFSAWETWDINQNIWVINVFNSVISLVRVKNKYICKKKKMQILIDIKKNWPLYIGLFTLLILNYISKYIIQLILGPLFFSICLTVITSITCMLVIRFYKNCCSNKMFTSDQWIRFILKNALISFILSTLKFNAYLPPSFLIISLYIQGFLSLFDNCNNPYVMSAVPLDWAKINVQRLDKILSSRYFRPEKEENEYDSEISEANENRLHFEPGDRKLHDWSNRSLENKYNEYKQSLGEQCDAATHNLNELEEFCKKTNSRFILSTRSYAADLEYIGNSSDEQVTLIKDKMQELDINYRRSHDKSGSRIRKSIKIIEELNDRDVNTENMQKDVDKKINRLADLDRKYSLEIFRVEKN